MKKRIFALLIILLILPLIGAACVTLKLKGGTDGGIFKSVDKADSWEQKVFVQQISKRKSETIDHVNVLKMFFDPQNSKTIYVITREDGAYVTYNGGEKWASFFSGATDIAVDPSSRHIIYVATGNRIMKSTDWGENWNQILLETGAINCLAVDPYDSNKIYANVSDGRMIISLDSGKSWTVLEGVNISASQMLINPNNSQIMYLVTPTSGILRTTNSGGSWENITVNSERTDLNSFSGINELKYITFNQGKSDGLLIATKYGLLKSDDGGRSWSAYKLLSSPGTVEILSAAINPDDNKEVYYSTSSALYKTSDGGKNWITKSLPTSRAAKVLLIDPDDPKTLYLGAMKVVEEKEEKGRW